MNFSKKFVEMWCFSEMAEYGWRTLMDQNGPLQAKMNPKWTVLVHFGLANAKIPFGVSKMVLMTIPVWTILVRHAFQQYRSHS